MLLLGFEPPPKMLAIELPPPGGACTRTDGLAPVGGALVRTRELASWFSLFFAFVLGGAQVTRWGRDDT